MGKKKSAKNRALNAFSTAVDDETYIKGLRQQQDIDLEYVADDNIRNLLSGDVNPDDDEDIDSDDAVGSGSDISLNEPESSEDEDDLGDSFDEAELRPLSELWDLESDDEESSKPVDKPAKSVAKTVAQEGSSSDSELDSDSSSEADSEAEADSDDLEGDDDFTNFSDEEVEDMDALHKAIAKVASGQTTDRHKLKVNAGAENPFALPSIGGTDEKLSLEDLGVAGVSEKQQKSQPLSIPLPQRVQEREDRAAAFTLTLDEVSKWDDTVKANRRADHLQFPMAPKQLETTSPFVASAVPQTSLESNIANILKQSALTDEKAIQTFEELAPSTLSFEELRERRNKLRQMRELMFREEQRAKRIKKIKSKSYRRVHKRERDKLAELEEASEDEDEEDQLRRRAVERATLRHKSSSKWAQRMADQGMTRDADTRAEMEEMLRQSDELRRKVMGDDDGDDEVAESVDIVDTPEPEPKKGVLGMKFMQDAEKREREANNRMLNDDYEEPEEVNIGRKTFTPAGQQLKRDYEQQESDGEVGPQKLKTKKDKKKLRVGDEEIITRPAGDTANATKKPAKAAVEEEDGANPWLQLTNTKGKSSFNSVGANSSKSEKAAASLAKAKSQTNKKKEISINVQDTLLQDSMVRESDLTLKQQDLVRRAFAGDDVVAEFEAEKQQTVEDEGDKEIDETLPGWGSWSSEAPRVQRIRKVKGVSADQRRDAKKKDVIINERINKKASKYSASAVPFPFENRAQYERSLRMPIGQEWVSKDTFQRQTKPRLIVKRGEVIEPLSKPKH